MRQLHWSNTPVQKKKRRQPTNSQSRRRGRGSTPLISCTRLTKLTQEATTLVLVVDRTNPSRRPGASPRPRADDPSCGRAVCNVHLRATRFTPAKRAPQATRRRADPRQDPSAFAPYHWQTGTRRRQSRPMGAAHLAIASLVPAGASTRRIQTGHQRGGFFHGSVRPFTALCARRTVISAPNSFNASFTTFSDLTNDERTRVFLALEVGAGYGEVSELSADLGHCQFLTIHFSYATVWAFLNKRSAYCVRKSSMLIQSFTHRLHGLCWRRRPHRPI